MRRPVVRHSRRRQGRPSKGEDTRYSREREANCCGQGLIAALEVEGKAWSGGREIK